eukprot:gb/GEZN01008495.1/.p1 GENE.gb/GEZN01008495.1/~~gb/GEZN01008495.1/.p1  ORF type:complete len:392 (-),score=80.86 gb/GEZN01008495.1/:181-1356(-)
MPPRKKKVAAKKADGPASKRAKGEATEEPEGKRDFSTDEKIAAELYKELDIVAQDFADYLKDEFSFMEEHTERVKKMIIYTCSGGKLNRGVLVVTTALLLAKSTEAELTEGQQKRALILGLCNEILQAYFLVADDIMDGSQLRRGRPCWYKVPEVQMDAVNDALILESVIYFLLKKYFGSQAPSLYQSKYLSLMELFHQVSLQTQMGQMLDLVSQPQGTKNPEILKKFTLDTYRKIVIYKTAFYSFYLPVACGLHLMGFHSEAQLAMAKNICVELGEKFQIEDDWLDAFGDRKKIGKDGTDIKDHKCTWLVVMALLKMSQEQRATLETCYGKEDDDSVQTVKKLYADLGLKEAFQKQEEESYARVQALLDDSLLPDQIFTVILDKIHLRDK